jgi:putative CocE/NonD family hydrolase
MEETSKVDTLFPFPAKDTYDWYLKLGPLSNVNSTYFFNRLPSWNNFVAHPNYDDYWKKQALARLLDSPRVPTLNVGGWWDQEDFYGPVEEYETWKKQDRRHYDHLVLGPWNHGGWGWVPGDHLGNIHFGSPTSSYFRREIEAKWFAWYLKGKGDGNFPEVVTFQTGTNVWKTYDSWPPTDAKTRDLYFREDGRLSFDPPAAGEDNGFDSYVSDPANPVPYRTRPIEETYGPGSRWYTWLTEDQRFVQDRRDVLSWATDTLKQDITLTGAIRAKLYAATSGSDADWVVKLIDVYPNSYLQEPGMAGYEFMIANDVFRGRFRHSFEKPEPITPGKVEEYSIDLHTQDHVFRKGHRIMVQVQSTWFPIIDRNPQKFVSNIFEAKEDDFQMATQKIYRSAGFPSHVELMTR